ncbi:MAG TPA: shikimate dehydrogenase [Usitatibacter sp.]|nr:shikimate dehydrogenase [Usitatibacter sp.]
MDRYAVLGNPVSHSLSPAIHARFGEITGDPIDYRALEAPIGGFAVFAEALFDSGMRGANVTLPFKVDAYELAAVRSDRAAAAGAANFLALRDGKIHADNTDGAGLVIDLESNLGCAIEAGEILIVGAGGASRGVVAPLLARKPRRLVIANRTADKARELAKHFASRGPVEGAALGSIPQARFSIVINATSTSTKGEALALPPAILEGALAYDMAYGAKADSFLAGARAAGAARTSDGLGMLVEQAAESFALWRGRRPPTSGVLEELRARR